MGIKNRGGSPGGTDRSIARRIWRHCPILLLLAALAACGFPRPPDIDDDTAPPAACTRDPDCSATTPFCVDATCVACRDSTSCPTARPVCDMTSHDCRTCAQDSECDSGACDLAAGTCIDQGAILYVSPGGTNADTCSRADPCSFFHAGSVVDPGHPYIVLLPGAESTAPLFAGTKATVVGGGNSAFPNIVLSNGADVVIRDLTLAESQANNLRPFGAGSAIACNGTCNLTLGHVTLQLKSLTALTAFQGGNITIRNSIIDNGSLQVSAHVVIDRSSFLSESGIVSSSTDQELEITNSIFVSNSGNSGISINTATNTASLGSAYIASNTFINSSIDCGGNSLYDKIFDSNIFNGANSLASPPGCRYLYNLITPSINVGSGTGNITGDPLFVNTANGDFRLQTGSPAIGAADPSPLPNGHDHDGKPRPLDHRADIGAFEYAP